MNFTMEVVSKNHVILEISDFHRKVIDPFQH